MAGNTTPPLFDMTTELRKRLEDQEALIKRVEAQMAAMKEIGYRNPEMEKTLAWAKKVRETLLKSQSPA